MDDHSHDSSWFCGFCYYDLLDGEFTVFPVPGQVCVKVIVLCPQHSLHSLLLLYPALVPEQLRER